MGAVLRGWMRRSVGLALATPLAGCVYPMSAEDVGDTGAAPAGGPSTYDVRGGGVQDGNLATVRDVLVSAPAQGTPPAFFVQDPDGGPFSGLKVQAAAGVDLPDLAVGERVTVSGTVQLHAGRYQLWLTRGSGLLRQGQGVLTEAVFDEPPPSWEPWLGVASRLAALSVTNCPDAAGDAPTDAGIGLGGPWLGTPPAFGDLYEGVAGVIADPAAGLALWPRDEAEAGIATPGAGCAQPITALRSLGLLGQVTVPDAVLSASADRWGGSFAQDADADAADAGLVLAALESGLPGDRGALAGLLENIDGRLILRIDQQPEPSPGDAPLPLPLPALDAQAIGSLVRVEALDIVAAGPYGSWRTDRGLSLSAARLNPLPVGASDHLTAAIGILDRWPDGTWVLIPRTAADLLP